MMEIIVFTFFMFVLALSGGIAGWKVRTEVYAYQERHRRLQEELERERQYRQSMMAVRESVLDTTLDDTERAMVRGGATTQQIVRRRVEQVRSAQLQQAVDTEAPIRPVDAAKNQSGSRVMKAPTPQEVRKQREEQIYQEAMDAHEAREAAKQYAK